MLGDQLLHDGRELGTDAAPIGDALVLQVDGHGVGTGVRDVLKDGRVHESVQPGEYDRDMSPRYLTVVANVEGEDMGRAAKQVSKAVEDAGEAPRGVRVEKMGQLPPMNEMFQALGIGLAVAVFVILVLLTAYFQSPRLALISIGAVPSCLAGIAIILLATGTTLNIESFMGSIMCLGVSVSNSVMMVTFMDEHWKAGKASAEAALIGASERLRPILMTACAMTVGMVPMALALERGSQMEAAARPCGHRGPCDVDVCHVTRSAIDLRVVIGKSKPHSPRSTRATPRAAITTRIFTPRRKAATRAARTRMEKTAGREIKRKANDRA